MCIQLLSHVWLFATPWIVAHQALLAMGFLRQEYGSGLPFPPPGTLPHPRDGTYVSFVSCIAGRFLTCWATSVQSVRLLIQVRLFVNPWTALHQASLSITNSWSMLKLTSMESVMTSNHLILCHPLLLLPSIFPNIRVFSNESVLRIR